MRSSPTYARTLDQKFKGNSADVYRFVTLLVLFLVASPVHALEDGFVPIFDGKTLDGWFIENKRGEGYIVRPATGELVCPAGSSGNLFTEQQYSDFILRFDFKLAESGNNGLAIRAEPGTDLAYECMELQILDNSSLTYAKLEPGQYHGSIYKVAPALKGYLKPVGQWNSQEVTVQGRRVKVVLNGAEILNFDLNRVTDQGALKAHPGILRSRGHIAFMGHEPSEVAFRNIRIKDLSGQKPVIPAGFRALFNGRNLGGWKGLVANPIERASMDPEKLKALQAEADRKMQDHWKAVDGELHFDGKGESICTIKKFTNFELLVDWKIEPGGDSGIYLRGTPQVQIWDREEGSGGLYNNQKNPNKPIKKADNPPGQWNTFRILMLGDRVWVFLNDKLVVREVTLESYWDRSQPLPAFEQIELQNHNNPLWFRNIFIRELP